MLYLTELEKLDFIFKFLYLGTVPEPAGSARIELHVAYDGLFDNLVIAKFWRVQSFLIVKYPHVYRGAQIFELFLRVFYTVITYW